MSNEPDDLAEENSRKGIEGTTWFLLAAQNKMIEVRGAKKITDQFTSKVLRNINDPGLTGVPK